MGIFAGLRTFTFGAIALRLLGALLCGTMVGVDREMRNKKAGLKTHVLVCLGAALCMIVSECIILGREGVTTDATRIAANVVTGVGFLCAASLITRGNGSLHGLTTAAGLWTTAVIGLACGSGWLEVGLLTAFIVLFVFAVYGRLDAYLTSISRGFDLYAEILVYEFLPKLLDALHAHDGGKRHCAAQCHHPAPGPEGGSGQEPARNRGRAVPRDVLIHTGRQHGMKGCKHLDKTSESNRRE